MDEQTPDTSVHDTKWRISIRWKVIQAFGATLIALGLFIDWPTAPEANVPDTSFFLIILGALLCGAGLLVAWRHK